MTPIDIAQSVLLAASLAGTTYAALRKKNHIETELRAQLDQALEENKRLQAEMQQTREALHVATVKVTPEVLEEYALQAVAYAEQVGGTNVEKLRHAIEAAQKLDAGDNGRRDWSDAQIRIAIEAALSK
jgi:regulator of replication initiation timing